MKAIVKYAKGLGYLEIRDISKPQIKENEVLIEIKAAGICGSDLHHYKVGDNITIPVVLGHEFSGEVVEIGKEVKGWKLGERVVSETHAHICDECYLCRSGDYHLCKKRKGFGSGVDGAFTQYISVPTRLLHRIPDNLSYVEAAVIQPAADIIHAVTTNTEVRPGDTVVVLGPGPMGLLTVEVSRAIGAGLVIIVGLNEDRERLEIAKKVGADVVINDSKENTMERVQELTRGRGADVVFEVSGANSAFIQGLEMLGQRGRMTIIGVHTQPAEIDIRPFQRAEKTLRGSAMSTWPAYEKAIQLTQSGRLQLKPLITNVLPITEWKMGFGLALDRKACKVIFTPVG